MKKILAIIGALAMAYTSQAQFTISPNYAEALTNMNGVAGTRFRVEGYTLSNVPSASYVSFPLGKEGLGVTVRVIGTNAATTTNATLYLQLSADGTYWWDTPKPKVIAPQNGTTVYITGTNIAPTVINNARYVRLHSIDNTNTDAIIFSNIVFSAWR